VYRGRVVFLKNEPKDPATVATQLNFPVFVKPNTGGSSIGMSKVNEAGGLDAAIAKAFKEDDQVLVEEMITGREFTVGVFRTKGNIIVLPLTEVKANAEQEFFDFVAKYQGIIDRNDTRGGGRK
jgi:D-alanine-D-alanine ligase